MRDRWWGLYGWVGIIGLLICLVEACLLVNMINRKLVFWGETRGTNTKHDSAWAGLALASPYVLLAVLWCGSMLIRALRCKQPGRCTHCGMRLGVRERRCRACGVLRARK